jgi:hypothetical protein
MGSIEFARADPNAAANWRALLGKSERLGYDTCTFLAAARKPVEDFTVESDFGPKQAKVLL